MKVALSCDQIVERDYPVEVFEVFCNLFYNSDAYCIRHKPGIVLGSIEQRKIKSTYLSRVFKKSKSLNKLAWLIPNAIKNIFISCENDFIFNVSTGFSHGINKCEKSKLLSYIYRMPDLEESFMSKIFSSYINKVNKENFDQIDTLWVSSEDVKKKILSIGYSGNIDVVLPPVDLQDYPYLEDVGFSRNTVIVNSEGVDLDVLENVVNSLENLGMKYIVVGHDDHLPESFKRDSNKFLGWKCSGELSPIILDSLLLIDLQAHFPQYAIRSMASGRGVIILENEFINEDLSAGIVCLKDVKNLKGALKSVNWKNLESKKLISAANKFHLSKFKGSLLRYCNDHNIPINE